MAQDRGGARSANVGSRSQSRTGLGSAAFQQPRRVSSPPRAIARQPAQRISTPPVPWRPAPAPVRQYTPAVPWPAPKPVWNGPANPAQGNWDMTPTYGPGGGGGNSGGGGGGIAAPAPPPVKRLSADDFAAKYKDKDGELAQTDSAFQDQKSMFAEVLKKYLADHDRQAGDGKDKYSGTIGREAKTALGGIGRNREQGLTSQAEDFFARGVGNSGLFATEQDKARDQYKRQETNVEDTLKDSRDDLNFRKAKFVGENGESGSNIQAARREAYNRLALKQQLL